MTMRIYLLGLGLAAAIASGCATLAIREGQNITQQITSRMLDYRGYRIIPACQTSHGELKVLEPGRYGNPNPYEIDVILENNERSIEALLWTPDRVFGADSDNRNLQIILTTFDHDLFKERGGEIVGRRGVFIGRENLYSDFNHDGKVDDGYLNIPAKSSTYNSGSDIGPPSAGDWKTNPEFQTEFETNARLLLSAIVNCSREVRK